MTVQAAAVRVMWSALDTSTGFDAIYRRDALAAEIRVVPGRTDTIADTLEDATQEFRTDDWITEIAQLVLNGADVVPQRGDIVEIIDGDEAGRYEVLPSSGEACYRYVGQTKGLVRIHTKRMDG